MARLARSRRDWSDDDDDDDEFPDIGTLVRNRKLQAQENASPAGMEVRSGTEEGAKPEISARPATVVRRRKLGQLSDNLLLRAWTPEIAGGGHHQTREKEKMEPQRRQTEANTRTTRLAAVNPPSPGEQEEDYVSAKEEITIIEVSIADDTFHSCGSEGAGDDDDLEKPEDDSDLEESEDSEFEGTESLGSDGDDDFLADSPPRRPAAKPRIQPKTTTLPSSDHAARQNTTAVGGNGGDSSQQVSKRALSTTLVPKPRSAMSEGGQTQTMILDKRLGDIRTGTRNSRSARQLDGQEQATMPDKSANRRAGQPKAKTTDKRLVDVLSGLQL